jgi:hypothetical protein
MYFKVRMTSSACSGSVISKTGVAVYADSCSSERLITKEIVSDEFKAIAYPNPSSNVFTIQVQSSSKGVKTGIQVYDTTGRLLENREVNSDSITLGSNYPSGIYQVIVKQGAITKTVRVIKR